MKIITTRRISQLFFFLLFIWFCVAATLGEQWWQLRGWPVNWLLQLDPLNTLSVLLATHTIYSGLLWAVATLMLTFLLGRFFCGWICPFGALQQLIGYLGQHGLTTAQRIARNRPHPGQRIKYWLLLFILAAASAHFLHFIFTGARQKPLILCIALVVVATMILIMQRFNLVQPRKDVIIFSITVLLLGIAVDLRFPQSRWLATSLQSGLLDPIALMHRSVNLTLLPILDAPLNCLSAVPRVYPGSMAIGVLFLLFMLLSLRIPRFYCRFICPLGALLGLCSRWSLWRIGQGATACKTCQQCEKSCEGACTPTETIHISECVLCLNCIDQCRHNVMGYHPMPSITGEKSSPDLTRRQVLTAVAAGLAAPPMMGLTGHAEANWNPAVIRPPGSLDETAFLSRCIKCGQCMRICPTNVIHPAGFGSGIEGLWTPILNYRTGSSGCQYNCVACSRICPTAAIRPLSLDERMGRGPYAAAGPIRTGMAFVDRGRCLPWAMDTPCIVCQENCPVSPKAIFTREILQPVRDSRKTVQATNAQQLVLDRADMTIDNYATGDFFCVSDDLPPLLITANTDDTITVAEHEHLADKLSPGQTIEIHIRLQRPYVDPKQCIGCGVCEHECPVQGRRAIRVTAENESRQRKHRLVLH